MKLKRYVRVLVNFSLPRIQIEDTKDIGFKTYTGELDNKVYLTLGSQLYGEIIATADTILELAQPKVDMFEINMAGIPESVHSINFQNKTVFRYGASQDTPFNKIKALWVRQDDETFKRYALERKE